MAVLIFQITKNRAEIQPRSQGLSSLPPLCLHCLFSTTMEAEKRDAGNEVGRDSDISFVCQCKDILNATTAYIRNSTGITVT